MLNHPERAEASVLLARDNFGCGSSREHAVWALGDYGFRCVIAPSFADIFFSNCYKNGFLPIVLESNEVESLFRLTMADPASEVFIDLPQQAVSAGDESFHFEIDENRKENLVKGLDEIGVTLTHAERIRSYEAKRRQQAPWLFQEIQTPEAQA